MKELTFRVYGVPRPAGSKKAFYNKFLKRAMVVDDNKNTKTWKGDVKDAAISVAPAELLDCPLELEITYYMPRPKNHYRTGKHAGELKENAPKVRSSKPDTDKLIRGTQDACKGVLWKDDSLVWHVDARKVYGDKPGAVITVRWEE